MTSTSRRLPHRSWQLPWLGRVLGVLLVLLAARPTAAQDRLDALPEPAWQRLLFAAGGATAEIGHGAAGTDALASLRAPAPGRTRPAFEDAAVAKLTASFTAERTDTVYRTEIWYRPETAEVLMRRRDKLGSGGSRKTFRFFAEGVERVRRDPDWWGGESDLPPERWSDVRESFYPYGPAAADCRQVTDPGLLLLAVAGGQVPEDGTPLIACVFNKQVLYRAELRMAGSERLAVDHRLTGAGGDAAAAGEIAVQRILLSTAPIAGSPEEPEAFEFFELRGDIEFLVDPAHRLPVLLAGEISGIGRIELRLEEAVVAP